VSLRSSEPIRILGRGHPAIRASHGKTLELTAESAITARASCVVGVGAQLPAYPVAGPIRLTLSAADASVSWRAIGNSSWWPASGSAVIRRSGQRLPDTFATDAEVAAGDLPRSLTEALADPATTVALLVERAAWPATGPATLVRCRLAGTGPDRLLAEAAAAGAVLAEDPPARAWLSSAGIPVSATATAAGCLAAGGRVLAVAGGEGSDLTGLLAAADAVEVLGLPAELAVSAAAADHAPVLHAEGVRWRELPLLAAAHPAMALTFRCPADRLPRLLAELGRERSSLVLAAMDDPERPVRGDLASLPLPDRGEVACRVAGLPAIADGPAIEPSELVRQLLAQSVTPRTVALAVAALPGWSRRAAYQYVLALSEQSAR